MTVPTAMSSRPVARSCGVVGEGNPQSAIRNPQSPTAVRAFTLLEVALAIALLALLAALVWPSLDRRIVTMQMPESAENLRAALRMSRASACINARRCRIRFEPGVQQPHLEYEVDPMNDAGTWETCPNDWATSPLLLGDVNVVRVIPGRPEYLTPVSHSAGMEDDEIGFETEQDGFNVVDEEGDPSEAPTDELFDFETEKDEDEDRPTITFDIDGSSDWYTLILARSEPGEELEENAEQIWIVLDGRTGLPAIQSPLTEEQLADASLRPDLDKLQPPQRELEDMNLEVPLGGEGMSGEGEEGEGALRDSFAQNEGDGESDDDAEGGLQAGLEGRRSRRDNRFNRNGGDQSDEDANESQGSRRSGGNRTGGRRNSGRNSAAQSDSSDGGDESIQNNNNQPRRTGGRRGGANGGRRSGGRTPRQQPAADDGVGIEQRGGG